MADNRVMHRIRRAVAVMALGAISASCSGPSILADPWVDQRVVVFDATVPRQCVIAAVASLEGFTQGPDPYRLTMVDFDSPISRELQVQSWIRFQPRRVDVAFSGGGDEAPSQKQAVTRLLDAEVHAISDRCLPPKGSGVDPK